MFKKRLKTKYKMKRHLEKLNRFRKFREEVRERMKKRKEMADLFYSLVYKAESLSTIQAIEKERNQYL